MSGPKCWSEMTHKQWPSLTGRAWDVQQLSQDPGCTWHPQVPHIEQVLNWMEQVQCAAQSWIAKPYIACSMDPKLGATCSAVQPGWVLCVTHLDWTVPCTVLILSMPESMPHMVPATGPGPTLNAYGGSSRHGRGGGRGDNLWSDPAPKLAPCH